MFGTYDSEILIFLLKAFDCLTCDYRFAQLYTNTSTLILDPRHVILDFFLFIKKTIIANHAGDITSYTKDAYKVAL